VCGREGATVLGGLKMCHLAKILSIVVVVWVAGSAAGATPPPPPVCPLVPFVKVSAPEGVMNVGYIWASGSYQTGAKVNVHVTANCPYQIDAALRNLRNKEGRAPVVPQNTMVAINGKQTTLGGKVTVMQSQGPTPPTGEDVPIGLQVGVKNLMQCPAGQYEATLVITVMAVP
jgi:hypothetical protein